MAKTSEDKPTVGRIVWVWLSRDDLDIYILDAELQNVPFRGNVLFVDPEGLARIEVTDHQGSASVIEELCQVFDPEPSDHHGDDESYVTWMPYQQKKHAQERAGNDARAALEEEGLDS